MASDSRELTIDDFEVWQGGFLLLTCPNCGGRMARTQQDEGCTRMKCKTNNEAHDFWKVQRAAKELGLIDA